ncbi:hypothetical protein ACFW3Z_09100 [Nocardiopsis alba]|jgi:drug/metabolite transporter (DMT)-like permease|uniref:hypothetical protein n=1 Tax=Nocardiopsis alba TaxID=53437 RepID=UPI0033A17E89
MRGCIVFVALGLLGGLGVTLFGEVLSGNLSALLWLLALIAAAVTAIVYANRLSPEDTDDDEEETEEEKKRRRFRNRLGLSGLALFIAMFPVSLLVSIFEATNALVPYVMGVGGVGFLLSLFGGRRGSGEDGEGDGGGE